MSRIKFELDDPSGNTLLTRELPVSNSENEQEDEQIQTVQLFFKQIQLVFRSIVPDIRALKRWQISILVVYAAFSVVFSILVTRSPLGEKTLLFFVQGFQFPPVSRRSTFVSEMDQ